MRNEIYGPSSSTAMRDLKILKESFLVLPYNHGELENKS